MMSTETITANTPTAIQSTASSTTPGLFNYYNGRVPEENDISVFEGKSPDVVKVTVPVQDIRPNVEAISLNVHGFQVLKHRSRLLPPSSPDQGHRFGDNDFVKSEYWPEIRSFLKTAFNARAVFVQNTTFRDAARTTQTQRLNNKNPRADSFVLKPFFIVHGDYSPPGGRSHLRALLPSFFDANDLISSTTTEERETFMHLRSEIVSAENAAMAEHGVSSVYDWNGENYRGPRYAIFSIWRPLATVQRDPLAIMDARDLSPSPSVTDNEDVDFIELPRTYQNRVGFEPVYKVTNILPRPPNPTRGKEHRWYWLKNQTPEEILAIKLFDSDASTSKGKGEGIAKFAAHSAFELEGSEDKEHRRSCELRVMVVW